MSYSCRLCSALFCKSLCISFPKQRARVWFLLLLVAVTAGCGGKQAPDVFYVAPICGQPSKVWVQFATGSDRDPLNTSSAQNAANYSVTGKTVNTSRLYSSDQAVVLTLNSALAEATSVNVSASSVQDTAGRTQSPTSTTLPLIYHSTTQGAVAQYFANRTLSGSPALTRVDSTIDFDVGSGSIAGVATNSVSARWYTFAEIFQTGDYSLRTQTDDGVRVWAVDIAGSKEIDEWYDMGGWTFTAPDIFTATSSDIGKRIPIVMEYYENSGNAQAHLYWDTPATGGYQIIPANRLFTCVAGPAAEQLGSFVFSVPATASTCGSATVTITARDGSGATLTGYTGSVTLSTSVAHGDWTLSTGAGSFSNGTADDGLATYTFAASDNGVVTLALSDRRADTLKVSANDASSNVTSQSSAIAFAENAFEISTNDTFNSDVIAGRNHTLLVQYVRRPASGAACQVDTGYTGVKNLKLWRTTAAVYQSDTAPVISSGSASVSVPASQPASNNFTSVTFASGQASLTLATSNVGQFSLNLRDDSSGYALDASGQPVVVTGSSSTYTVRPFGLRVVATSASGGANPAATSTAAGSAFVSAGTAFNIAVTGVAYQAADDVNPLDGIPDGHNNSAATSRASLADNTALSRFGNEGSAPAISLANTLVMPSGGSNPGLTGTTAFSAFASGSSTVQRSFSDVGSIDIAATVSNYLGSGRTLYGDAGVVGRFIPAWLDVSDAQQPSLAHGHGTCTYTYQGETVAYQQSPGLLITAKNVQGGITNNYGNSLWRLDLPTAASLSETLANLPAGSTTSLTRNTSGTVYSWAGTTNYDGAATLYLSGDTYTFNKSAASGPSAGDVPFTPKLKLTLTVAALTDLDNVCYRVNGAGACSTYVVDAADNTGFAGTELRYARLRLTNAYGTTDAAILMPASVEYWKTVGAQQIYVPATDENSGCVGVSLSAANITLDNYQGALSAGEVTTSFSGIPAGGNGVISLRVDPDADPATVSGSVRATLSVPASLRYNQSSSGLVNPSGVAAFGVYGGRAPIFNIQEGFR